MKKILVLLISITVLMSSTITSFAATAPPVIMGETAVLIDASTGEILYDKNMNDQRYPASTTKIITALLALENLKLSDTVTIDAETPYTEGSRVYLLEGEQVTVKQLMYALLLESANDSAVALGKEVGGTIPDFAKLMNKRAAELGAKNTNFVNPNGLNDPAHLTTAYDLAMIAKGAMKNEAFRKFVRTYKYVIPATNKQDTRYLYSTNRLLYDKKTRLIVNGVERTPKYDGVTGIKTGYTSDAGGCLVAGAKRGDTELISVVMKSTDQGRFADSIALLDYGFENYKSVIAMDKGAALGSVKINRGAVRTVKVAAAEDAYATLPVEASGELVKTKIVLDKKVKAPVEKGQKVGTVEIYEGETLVGEVDAVAANKVDEGGVLSVFGIPDSVARIIIIAVLSILAALILLVVVYILLKRRQIRRRRKRRAQRALQSRENENKYRY